ALAFVVSIDLILAWACGERSTCPKAMPGNATSSTYLPPPRNSLGSSNRGTPWPIANSPIAALALHGLMRGPYSRTPWRHPSSEMAGGLRPAPTDFLRRSSLEHMPAAWFRPLVWCGTARLDRPAEVHCYGRGTGWGAAGKGNSTATR